MCGTWEQDYLQEMIQQWSGGYMYKDPIAGVYSTVYIYRVCERLPVECNRTRKQSSKQETGKHRKMEFYAHYALPDTETSAQTFVYTGSGIHTEAMKQLLKYQAPSWRNVLTRPN